MNQPELEKQPWQSLIGKTVITVVGKIGCLTFAVAAGSAFLGWLLDGLLGTRPWLMIVLFITSVPFSMLVIYLVVKSSVPISPVLGRQIENPEEVTSRDETP
ncbi:MAG: hypothetical protein ABIJ39_08020 [Chloroflexota bacterium]